jgi:hypothetical protein
MCGSDEYVMECGIIEDWYAGFNPRLQLYALKIHDFSLGRSRFFHDENKEKICHPVGWQIF